MLDVKNTARLRAGGEIDIAIATIGADHFADEDFACALDLFPKLGVPNVELMCWYPRNLTPEGLKRAHDRFAERGMRTVSIHYLAFKGWSAATRNAEIGYMLWMLEACKAIGATVLKFTGPSRQVEGALGGIIETLRHVVPAAEDAGISIVLENHFQNALEFQDDYEEVFSQVDSPNLGVCLDMGHFAASGVDMVALVEAMPDKIHHIDMKDCRAEGAADFVRYGTGIVPFEPVIDRAIALGFDGYLIVELPRIDRATMEDDLRKGIELARKYATAG